MFGTTELFEILRIEVGEAKRLSPDPYREGSLETLRNLCCLTATRTGLPRNVIYEAVGLA